MTETRLPTPPVRPMPALTKDSAFYWTSGSDGHLRIARCEACKLYIHPPRPYCASCGSFDVRPSIVRGQGRVASFTINEQKWLPGLETPYVIAMVELTEQAELHVFTNIIGCAVGEVDIGMPVAVTFEQHGEVYLPMFEPVGEHHE